MKDSEQWIEKNVIMPKLMGHSKSGARIKNYSCNIYIKKEGWLEDGGEVCGSLTHLLVHPTGISSWSSEEQSGQQTKSQFTWSLKVKDCRGH